MFDLSDVNALSLFPQHHFSSTEKKCCMATDGAVEMMRISVPRVGIISFILPVPFSHAHCSAGQYHQEHNGPRKSEERWTEGSWSTKGEGFVEQPSASTNGGRKRIIITVKHSSPCSFPGSKGVHPRPRRGP